MGRGALSFKHSDIVRAVRAAQAAGLSVVRTEIHADGRIVLHHQLVEDEREEREETYEEWKARTNGGRFDPLPPVSPKAAQERLERKLDMLGHEQKEASRLAREEKRRAIEGQGIDPNSPDLPRVFTPSTLAAHWGCSATKVRNLVRSGELAGFMLGNRLLRVQASEVLAYEARIRATPSEPEASAPASEKRARAPRLDIRRSVWR